MPSPPLRIGSLITTVRDRQYEPVTLTDADRSQPVYMIGKPDKGKSTLMLNMIAHDIAAGDGFAFIEPDANNFYRILDLIPPDRLHDVIALDYSDHAYPVPLNPFDGYEAPEYRDHRHLVTSALMASTKQIFAESWSVTRMQRALKHAYTACVEKPNTTFLSVPRMFEEIGYRYDIAVNLDDLHAQNFWKKFAKRSPKYQTDVGEPIINRIEQLYSNPILCNVLCQPKNTYNLADHIQRGGIVVANLGRSANGEDAANLLGTLLFSRLFHTAMTLGERSVPFTFYFDDFTEYALPVFPQTFSQSPHLRFALAHQHMAQLDDYPKVRAAILGSAGTLVVFQLSAHDADRYFKQELDLDPSDYRTPKLTHIPSYQAIAKVTQDGYTDTVNMFTPVPPVPQHNYSDAIIENNRILYATPRAEVEEYVRDWYDRDDGVPHIHIKASKPRSRKSAN
jgi:hypothetical protein